MNAVAKSYSMMPDSVPDESAVALELVVEVHMAEPRAAILAREIGEARRMITELRELIVRRQAEVEVREDLIHRYRHKEAHFRSSMSSGPPDAFL